MPMKSRKIDLAPWYWGGFYRRGAVSHVMRTYRMRKIPMPLMRHAWPLTALAQSLIPLFPNFMRILTIRISVERDALAKLIEESKTDKIKLFAPAGSLSPLSCDAAVVEIVELCEFADQSLKVFRQRVTMPFLKATLYELALLALLLIFSLAPTWFVYALTIGKATYVSALACTALCYLLALPRALKLFTHTTMTDPPPRALD